MYFPYVYGRRHELLALRSASSKYLSSEIVIPIIEPVKNSPNDLIRCLEVLGKEKLSVIVIVNPIQGDFRSKPSKEWKTALGDCFEKYNTLIPGALLHSGARAPKLAAIETFASKHKGREIALLYRNSGLSHEDNAALTTIDNVAYHVVLQQKISSSHLKILPSQKLVHIIDAFNKQARNADYGSAELFSDSYKNFKERGIGFGDYTIIGEPYQEGGGPPGAVAIHITYRDSKKDEIWIEHFLSDEVEREVGTVESKYLEALEKLTKTHKKRSAEFGLNQAISEYFDDYGSRHFPGLGKNKERQVLHHIARIHDILNTGS